jgi:hypothetical protein
VGNFAEHTWGISVSAVRCARIGPPSVLESLDTLLIEALTEQEADAFYAALDV